MLKKRRYACGLLNRGKNPRERGHILFTALAVGLIVFLPIASLLIYVSTVYMSNRFMRDKLISVSIAESGLADGFYRWRDDFEWDAKHGRNDFTKVKYGDNHYVITAERTLFPEKIKINSTGSYRNIETDAEQEYALITPLIYALHANNNILIDDGARIEGAVKSGGIVFAGKNAVINGNIITSKFVKNYGGADENKIFERVHFYRFDFPDIRKLPDEIVVLQTGYVENETFENKIVYSGSGVDITNCRFIESALIARGNVKLNGRAVFSAAENFPAITLTGNLTVEGENNSVRGVICAGGRVEVEGALNVRGTIIADDIELRGKVFVNYDKNNFNIKTPMFPVFFNKTSFKVN